jgi:8-oxo-dGTP pyrophosphatase MutT (NUDIX family)
MAVLTVGDRLAVQLRDDKPGIANPGHWGLFSGHLEPGETPREAVRREIQEELRLEAEPDPLFDFGVEESEFYGGPVRVHAFRADVSAVWERYELREGQCARLVTPDELAALRPLAPLSAEVLRRWLATLSA